jgi:type I restriction enzyme, S subunit
MSEWKECKLGELGIVITGKTPSINNPEEWGNEMPFVTPSDFKDYRKFAFSSIRSLSNEGINRLKNKILPENSILVTCIGSDMGKVAMNGTKVITNQQINSIVPKSNKINSDFLYYRLVSIYETLRIYGGDGTAVPIVNKSDFENIETEIPPLPEQHAIASVLSSLDDKIDLLHRQNQTLEKMAETLFRQWFVEEAKEDWESLKIKDFDVTVTDFVANGSFASLAENVTYKSVPDYAILIRLTDFNNNFNGEFVYVDKQAYNFLNKSKLFGGEIIISNVGAYSGTVFKCPILNRPMTLGPNSIVLKSNFNNYFYLLFKSTYGKFLLDGIISGSAQPKFNKTAFRDIQISFPSTDYLIEFENLIKSYFDKIDKNIAQIRTLSTLRETLLPKLMSGEVRVEIV